MKRSLVALLLIVFATTTSGAATTKKKARKASKPTTIERQALTGEAVPAQHFKREKKQADVGSGTVVAKPGPIPFGPPSELVLKRAGSRRFDLRSLPQTPPVQQERAELPEPPFNPVTIQGVVTPPEQNGPVGQPRP